MASMAPAAQASRRKSPWRMVIDRAAVGNIGAPSGLSVWESRVAGGRGAGKRGLAGLGMCRPTRWRRMRVVAVGSRARTEPGGGAQP
jgi:hypothetical protein